MEESHREPNQFFKCWNWIYWNKQKAHIQMHMKSKDIRIGLLYKKLGPLTHNAVLKLFKPP